MSEAMLKEGEIFEDEEDEIQFEEMHKLFTTNPLVLREFANSINDSVFEQLETKDRPYNSFNKKYFQLQMQGLDYKYIKPEEMRQKFTEFVMMNQALALDDIGASQF